jgi:hypothetical protein
MCTDPELSRYQPSDQPDGNVGGSGITGIAVHVVPLCEYAGTKSSGAFGNVRSTGWANEVIALPPEDVTSRVTATVPAVKENPVDEAVPTGDKLTIPDFDTAPLGTYTVTESKPVPRVSVDDDVGFTGVVTVDVVTSDAGAAVSEGASTTVIDCVTEASRYCVFPGIVAVTMHVPTFKKSTIELETLQVFGVDVA